MTRPGRLGYTEQALLASIVPMIPLYQRPTPLIHKSGLLGMVNNPGLNGVYWDVEAWHWK